MTEEIWKPVVGYEGLYEVSNYGRVRSLHSNNNLSPWSLNYGHLSVGLYLSGKRKKHLVHRLVMAAFVGPCPDKLEVCHNDGNPKNNNLENLRYDTRQGNNADKLKHGTDNRGEKHSYSKLKEEDVKVIRALRDVCSLGQLAKNFGVSKSMVCLIQLRKCWAHV